MYDPLLAIYLQSLGARPISYLRYFLFFFWCVYRFISFLIRISIYISQGYFLSLVSAAFSFSSNHTNSAITRRSIVTTLSSTLLRPLHLWFHTDLLISVCNFVYVLHLIKPWFILCVRIVFSATLVTFEGYSWEKLRLKSDEHCHVSTDILVETTIAPMILFS